MTGRDYRSPRYVRWRKAIFARDGFCCRLCGSRDGINAHHIKQWARYPSLRFAIGNGITLCRIHHLQVTGQEEEYEGCLGRLVRAGDDGVRLAMILMRHADQDKN